MAFNIKHFDNDEETMGNEGKSREVKALIGAGLTIFFMLCNFHLCMALGDMIFMFLHGFFGWMAYILPIYAYGMYLLKLYRLNDTLGEIEAGVKFRFSLILFLEFCFVIQLFQTKAGEDYSLVGYFTDGSTGFNGGLISGMIVGGVNHIVGPIAAWLFVLVILIITIFVLTELNASEFLSAVVSIPASIFGPITDSVSEIISEAFPKKGQEEASQDDDEEEEEAVPKKERVAEREVREDKEDDTARSIAAGFFSRVHEKTVTEQTVHFDHTKKYETERHEAIHTSHFTLNYNDSYNRKKNLDYLNADLRAAYGYNEEPKAHVPTSAEEKAAQAAQSGEEKTVKPSAKKEEKAPVKRDTRIVLQRPHVRISELGFSKEVMEQSFGDYGPDIASEKYKTIDSFIAFNGTDVMQTAAGGIMRDLAFKKVEDDSVRAAASERKPVPAMPVVKEDEDDFVPADDERFFLDAYQKEEIPEPSYDGDDFYEEDFTADKHDAYADEFDASEQNSFSAADEDDFGPEERESMADDPAMKALIAAREASASSVSEPYDYDVDPEDYLEEDGPDGYDVTEHVVLPEDGPVLREKPQNTAVPQRNSAASSIRNTSIWANDSSKGARESSGAKSFNDVPKPVEKKKVNLPYVPPRYELIKRGKAFSNVVTQTHTDTQRTLFETLESFGVGVEMGGISVGPAVTRYELLPQPGVKVARIVSLQDDIKLALAASDIRIEAPIPGKSAIGIEVPNKENTAVGFRDLIESDVFKNHKSKVAVCVGRDIAGQIVVADLAKMPHLLIAGATGSGKSVCINTLIMSLLYKASPDEVKLIMVDPKVVELSVYNGIPHLLIPVVTDPRKAANALKWAVDEMDDRYNRLAEFNVRNIQGYNDRLKKIKEDDPENEDQFMYQMVIIVDELADLMMVASQEVEESICRLAQKARAAGIHLVLATQRPSVNVITGLIKANVPSRIAFAVSSGVDSRTIIDQVGAEKLLGKGDMLYHPYGLPKPVRVQGAFISDEEVTNVVDYITKYNGGPSGKEQMEAMITSQKEASASVSDRDEYFLDAGRFIIEKDKASIGNLQRNFRIGFNRAARIMDQLFEAGVVGEEEGTKPRKVLMDMNEFERHFGA